MYRAYAPGERIRLVPGCADRSIRGGNADRDQALSVPPNFAFAFWRAGTFQVDKVPVCPTREAYFPFASTTTTLTFCRGCFPPLTWMAGPSWRWMAPLLLLRKTSPPRNSVPDRLPVPVPVN